ncbi:hypothetical protein ABPG74_005294 [Tetrahymena malaccensis]
MISSQQQPIQSQQQQQQFNSFQRQPVNSMHRAMNGQIQQTNKPNQAQNQFLHQKNLHQNQAQPNKRIKTIKKPSLMARAGRNVVDERKNSFPTQSSEQPKYIPPKGQLILNGVNRGNNNPGVNLASTSQTSYLSTNNTLILANNNSNNMNSNQNQSRRVSNNINGQINKHFEKKHVYDKKINQIGNCQGGNLSNHLYQGASQPCVQCGQNGCNSVCGLSIVGQQIQNGGNNSIQGNNSNLVSQNQQQDSQRMRFQASAQNILNQSGLQRIQVNGQPNNSNIASQSSSSCFSNQQQNNNIQNRQNSNQVSIHSSNNFLESSQQNSHNNLNQNNSHRNQRNPNVANGRNNNIRNIPIQELININQNQIQLNNHGMDMQFSNKESQYHTLTSTVNDQFNRQNDSPLQILASNRHQRVRQAAAQVENANNQRANSNNSNNQHTMNSGRARNPQTIRSFSNKNNSINQNQNRQNGNQNLQGIQNENQIHPQNQYQDLQIVGISTEGNQINNQNRQPATQQSQLSHNNIGLRHNSLQNENIRRNSMQQPSSNGQQQISNIQFNQAFSNSSASNLNDHRQNQQQQARQRIIVRPNILNNQTNNQQQQNRPSQQQSLSETLNELSYYQNGNTYNQYMNQTGMSHIQMVNNEYLNLNINSLAQSTTSDFFGNTSNGYNQFLNGLNQSIIERYNYEYDNQNNHEHEVELEEEENVNDNRIIQDIEGDDQNENEEQKQEDYEDYTSQFDQNFIELSRIRNLQANQLNFMNQIMQINNRQQINNNHQNSSSSNNNTHLNFNQQNINLNSNVQRRISNNQQNQQQINHSHTPSQNTQNQSTNNNSNYGYDIFSNENNHSYNQSQTNHFLPNIYYPSSQTNQHSNIDRRQYERTQHAEPHTILSSYQIKIFKNLYQLLIYFNIIGQNGRRNRRRWNQQLSRNNNQAYTMQEYIQKYYGQQSDGSNSNLNSMHAFIDQNDYNNNNLNNFIGYQSDYRDYNDDSEQESYVYEEEEEEKQSFERYNFNSHMFDNGYLFQQYQEEDSQYQQDENYDQQYIDNMENNINFEEDIGSYDNDDDDDEDEEDNQEEDDDDNCEQDNEDDDDDDDDEDDNNQSQIFENNFNITLQINSPNEINFNVNQINIDIDNQMYENSSQISLPDPRFFDEFARNLMRDILNRQELNSLISRHIYSFQIDSEALQLQQEESNQVPGMNQEEIDKMKTTFHTSNKTHKTCAICLNDFDEGEKVKELNCEHRFHIPCVDDWLKIKGSCPLCRQNLVQENPVQQNEENQDLQVEVSY